MRHLFFFCFSLLLLTELTGQTARHSFSLRGGLMNARNYTFVQPDPEVSNIRQQEDLAFTVGLRYHYLLDKHWRIHAGGSLTRISSGVLFDRPPTEENPFRGGSGPGIGSTIRSLELGVSYLVPIADRFTFVAEVGGQLIRPQSSSGAGSNRMFTPGGEELFSATYSYALNPEDRTGLALLVAPALEFAATPHLIVGLRVDALFSDVLLVESGMVEVNTSEKPEPSFGAFSQKYGGFGINFMAGYRF